MGCCALVAAQNACSGKLYLLGRVFFGVALVGFEQNFTWCVRLCSVWRRGRREVLAVRTEDILRDLWYDKSNKRE